MTRIRLTPSHRYYQPVQSGTMDPIDACMNVLASANLTQSGSQTGYVANSNTESLAVLKTFNDFHRTWFPNDYFPAAITNGDAFSDSPLILDFSESALHVTQALFSPGVSYSSVVTGTQSMEAIRSGMRPYGSFQVYNVPNVPGGSVTAINPDGATQIGTLQGVRPGTRTNQTMFVDASNTANAPSNPVAPDINSGGGILGSTTYLILNMGRPDFAAADGGLRQMRRWSKAVFNDLLCRNVPVIRVSDAVPYVTLSSSAQSNTPPFRLAATCMSCHVGMDPVAAVARNKIYASSSRSSMVLQTFPVTQPREVGLVNSDPLFAQRPPNGALNFRSYDGTMISQQLNGLAGLGSVLAATQDLYACAASRYFYFFTGIVANLQDIGDPDNQAITGADLDYRNQVIQLGQTFKTTQNTQQLIRSILSSSLYRTTSMRE